MTTTTNIAADFKALVNGNTHIGLHGIAGTKSEVRSKLWESFRSTYTENVTIKVEGEIITLKANHSLSGKSTSYFSTISKEAYAKIIGSAFGLKKEKMPFISIEAGTVRIHGGGKFYVTLDNKIIEII